MQAHCYNINGTTPLFEIIIKYKIFPYACTVIGTFLPASIQTHEKIAHLKEISNRSETWHGDLTTITCDTGLVGGADLHVYT